MNLTFVHLPAFVAKWSRSGLTDDDLQSLEGLLRANPVAGPVMAGTGGVRKVRFAAASAGSGKSGGRRVGYVYVRVADAVYFLAVFAKNEKANFSAADKAELRRISEALTAWHRRQQHRQQ